jgi:hypothetical protein
MVRIWSILVNFCVYIKIMCSTAAEWVFLNGNYVKGVDSVLHIYYVTHQFSAFSFCQLLRKGHWLSLAITGNVSIYPYEFINFHLKFNY